MDDGLLQRTVQQYYSAFRVAFPCLTEQDLQSIVQDITTGTTIGTMATFLALSRERHGYTRTEAIHKWNEFVLHYVDGQSVDGQSVDGQSVDGQSVDGQNVEEKGDMPSTSIDYSGIEQSTMQGQKPVRCTC